MPAPIVASIIDERRISDASGYIYLAQKPPIGCRGCEFLHGQMYNGELLVCAIHPSGQDNCPDYQEKMDRVK